MVLLHSEFLADSAIVAAIPYKNKSQYKKKDKGVAKTFRFTLKLEPIEVNFVDFVDSSHGGKRLETNEHFEAFNKT